MLKFILPLLLLTPMGVQASSMEETVGAVEVCPGVLRVQIMERGKLYEFYESTDKYQAPGEKELVCEKYFEFPTK